MRTVGLTEGENFIGSHSGSDEILLINSVTLALTNELVGSGPAM